MVLTSLPFISDGVNKIDKAALL